MARQFIACKYRPTDKRFYSFHNDGEPVAVGDHVKIANRSGKGWMSVEVAEILSGAPDHETKAILGIAEPESDDGAPAATVEF